MTVDGSADGFKHLFEVCRRRAIAIELVRRGYAVVVTDVAGDAARRTALEIGAAGGLVHDVRDESAHHPLAATAARHGPLKVWVNNAGVGFDGSIDRLSPEHIRALVDVNPTGVVWGAGQRSLPWTPVAASWAATGSCAPSRPGAVP
ncbi:MAG: SDR family NAD(P)-dependent oxidoreductase [Nocardioidaceae bacterium]